MAISIRHAKESRAGLISHITYPMVKKGMKIIDSRTEENTAQDLRQINCIRDFVSRETGSVGKLLGNHYFIFDAGTGYYGTAIIYPNFLPGEKTSDQICVSAKLKPANIQFVCPSIEEASEDPAAYAILRAVMVQMTTSSEDTPWEQQFEALEDRLHEKLWNELDQEIWNPMQFSPT